MSDPLEPFKLKLLLFSKPSLGLKNPPISYAYPFESKKNGSWVITLWVGENDFDLHQNISLLIKVIISKLQTTLVSFCQGKEYSSQLVLHKLWLSLNLKTNSWCFWIYIVIFWNYKLVCLVFKICYFYFMIG